VRGLPGAPLLSRRDWVYSLGLLVPLFVYSLALKALDVASGSGDPGLGGALESMRSDIFFNLGYASLWVGLFAVTRGPARRAVVVLFHVVTMLVVAVTTLAHLYLWQTGDTLDYGTVAGWVSRLDEMQPGLYEGGGPLWVRVVLFAALARRTREVPDRKTRDLLLRLSGALSPGVRVRLALAARLRRHTGAGSGRQPGPDGARGDEQHRRG
jgi:hypothetical protein